MTRFCRALGNKVERGTQVAFDANRDREVVAVPAQREDVAVGDEVEVALDAGSRP